MATVRGLTAERMEAIEAQSVVAGEINESGHLILTTFGGDEIDAGSALVAVPDQELVHFLSSSGYSDTSPPSAYPDGLSLMWLSDAEATADWPTFAGKWGSLFTTNYTPSTSDQDTFQVWSRLHGTGVTPEQWIRAGNLLGWSAWKKIALAETVDAVASSVTALTNRVVTLEAVTPAQVGFTGEIRMYAGTTAPSGWRICDGSTLNRTGSGAALFAVIGTTYGVGNGSSTYNLPNFKGRVPVGLDAAQTEFNALGVSGGAKTHTLTEAQMPSHTHVQNPHTHVMQGNGALTDGSSGTAYVVQNGTFYGFRTDQPDQTTAVNQATGGGQAHNNLQPYLTINYIIKL